MIRRFAIALPASSVIDQHDSSPPARKDICPIEIRQRILIVRFRSTNFLSFGSKGQERFSLIGRLPWMWHR